MDIGKLLLCSIGLRDNTLFPSQTGKIHVIGTAKMILQLLQQSRINQPTCKIVIIFRVRLSLVNRIVSHVFTSLLP